MNIGISVIITIAGAIVGFLLNRFYERKQKKKAGLTGNAHNIIKDLSKSVQSFEGYYLQSKSPKENFTIINHVYKNATGEIIGTCFRENPIRYQDHDLVQLLPKGAFFTRLTTDSICPEKDRKKAEAVLKDYIKNSRIINIPLKEVFTSIDGVFAELSDQTYIAFITFPKLGLENRNRGIIFYGNTAKSFFDYYKDLRDTYSKEK